MLSHNPHNRTQFLHLGRQHLELLQFKVLQLPGYKPRHRKPQHHLRPPRYKCHHLLPRYKPHHRLLRRLRLLKRVGIKEAMTKVDMTKADMIREGMIKVAMTKAAVMIKEAMTKAAMIRRPVVEVYNVVPCISTMEKTKPT